MRAKNAPSKSVARGVSEVGGQTATPDKEGRKAARGRGRDQKGREDEAGANVPSEGATAEVTAGRVDGDRSAGPAVDEVTGGGAMLDWNVRAEGVVAAPSTAQNGYSTAGGGGRGGTRVDATCQVGEVGGEGKEGEGGKQMNGGGRRLYVRAKSRGRMGIDTRGDAESDGGGRWGEGRPIARVYRAIKCWANGCSKRPTFGSVSDMRARR